MGNKRTHAMIRGRIQMSVPALLAVLLLGHATVACANPLDVTTSVGGVPGSGSAIDIGALPLGTAGGIVDGANFSFSGNAGVVSGTLANRHAAPYASGDEGSWFGGGDGPVTGEYLTAGNDRAVAGSGITISFSLSQIAFGVLWGSIDSYNKIEVYDGATLLGTVTETPPMLSFPGFQGEGGSAYVEVTSSTPFDRLVFSSDGYAFEFADFMSQAAPIPAAELATKVPEPGSLAILGIGLAVLAAARIATRRGKPGRLPLLPA
jgi:hypothetical protein